MFFDANPIEDIYPQDYPVKLGPQRHLPFKQISFALHYFGHLYTAHTA